MAYCTIADVLGPFPRFQQALPNNISNASIQGWIDIGKAEIRSRFLRRGIDPDSPSTLGWNPPLITLTADQSNVLRKFNTAYGLARFGDAAFSQLNDGELKIVERAWEEWKSMSMDTDASGKELRRSGYILGNDGAYDALFDPSAAHVQVSPLFGGMAGADFDPAQVNNRTMGTFFMFEKAQKF